jgi:sulfur-oxidizing protein SoxX
MVRKHYRRHVRLIAAATLALSCAVAQEMPGMSQSLTGQPGDALRGKAVAVDSNRGNCTICHQVPIAEVPAAAAGNLGPSLAGVGSRLSEAQLRERIFDARRVNPHTLMPPYHTIDGLQRVQARYAGRPLLTAQEVEDLVAFLVTLR